MKCYDDFGQKNPDLVIRCFWGNLLMYEEVLWILLPTCISKSDNTLVHHGYQIWSKGHLLDSIIKE